MLLETEGKRINGYVKDYTIFDLETTGVSCMSDAIVEISAVKVRNGEVVDEFSSLVNPGCPIPFGVSMVNNITDDMVEDAPYIEEVLPEFLDFIGDDVLVGHNIQAFDMKFISRDSEKLYGLKVGNDFADTLRISRQFLPEMEHHSLTDLACHYHISTAGAHRALNDCRMNQLVYEHLKDEIKNAGLKGIYVCPKCGQALKKRKGKFGEFLGCPSYPDCKFTRNIW